MRFTDLRHRINMSIGYYAKFWTLFRYIIFAILSAFVTPLLILSIYYFLEMSGFESRGVSQQAGARYPYLALAPIPLVLNIYRVHHRCTYVHPSVYEDIGAPYPKCSESCRRGALWRWLTQWRQLKRPVAATAGPLPSLCPPRGS